MSGELCGSACGWCGRCDADYVVRCETPGCHTAVSLPETDVYCATCRLEHEARAKRRMAPAQIRPLRRQERA